MLTCGLRWSLIALVLGVLSCGEKPPPPASDTGGTRGDGDGDGDGPAGQGGRGDGDGDGDGDLDASTIDPGHCRPGTDGPDCEPCMTGTYCPGNEPGTPCTTGHWDHDSNSATACRSQPMCPAGEYIAEAGDSTHQRVCEACPPGSFAPSINTPSCTDHTVCEPGQYVASAGTALKDRTCRDCSASSHTSLPNAPECIPNVACLPGYQVTRTGCLACDPGSYCPGNLLLASACYRGTWDHDQDPATRCVDWSQCPSGTYVSEDATSTTDRVCEGCAAGSFTSRDNADNCTEWRTCPSGERVVLDGTDKRNRTCEPCPDGFTSDGPNATDCRCAGDAGACDAID